MMRTTLLICVLTLTIGLTGCPPKTETPKMETTPAASGTESPAGAVEQSSAPVPAQTKPATPEPSTEEAKAAVKLVTEMNGKFELTPTGTIKSIIIDSSALNEEAFDLFAKQADMETLQISNFRDLSDGMVERLSGLKNLRRLKLSNAGITDAAVKTIAASFPNLTDLDLSSNTLLTDVSLKEIAKLKELEQLTIIYCNFSEFGMMEISGLPKLKMLDIRANMQVGNGGLGYLTSLPELKTLKHMSTAVDDFGMEALSQSKGLETLEIQDFNITDRAGEFIKQFEGLTNLIIFRCQGFGSSGLQELKGMNLSRLTLRDLPSIDDVGMEAFRELPTLKRLYLRELNSVTDAGIMNLVYLKDLELLSVWEVPVSDQSVETISKLSNLKNLTLRSTEITDNCIDILLKMPKLDTLAITDNSKLSASSLERLKSSKKFKKLETEALIPKR